MRTFWQELRQGARMLRRSPLFSFSTISILALGIGANSAIFALVNGILLSPLSLPAPERLVLVDESHPASGLRRFGVSPANWTDWSASSRAFSGIATFLARDANAVLGGQPFRTRYLLSSVNLFSVLGVAPQRGRGFTETESKPGEDAVVVVSHAFWQSRLGGRDDTLGSVVTIDERPHEIVGIMPTGFEFPSPDIELWKPLALDPDEAANRDGRWLEALGRLEEGADLESARAEMGGIAERLAAEHPSSNEGFGVTLTPLHESMVQGVRRGLLLLWAITGLVLLIGCANVAHLVLARTAGRSRELDVRIALGASRRRLARQLLAESLLVSIPGALAGLLLASLLVKIAPRLGGASLPRAEALSLEPTVVWFTLGLSLLTTVLLALVPAARISKELTGPALRASAGVGGRMGFGLVATEVAVALVVLVVSGLLLRSLQELLSVDPGFEPRGVVSFRIEPPRKSEPGDGDLTARFRSLQAERQRMAGDYARLLEELESIPGVVSAGAVNRPVLLGSLSWLFHFEVEGREPVPYSELPAASLRVVTPSYFRAMGIPLRQGRYLGDPDDVDAPRVALIDETMARRYWPGTSPLGERVTYAAPGVPEEIGDAFTFEVVGVVGDVRNVGLESSESGTMYTTLAQAVSGHFEDWGMTVVVRTRIPDAALAEAVRERAALWDPSLPLFDLRAMEETLAGSVAPRRFQTTLLSALALLALVLAAAGIYGVVACAVTERTREIGLRMALGASRAQVLAQVFREGMRPVALGLVVGAIAALSLGSAVSGQLFGVPPHDPPAFALGAAVLVAVALGALWLPAHRASRSDPMDALRHD